MRHLIAGLFLLALGSIAVASHPWLLAEGKKHIESISLSLELLATVLGALALFDFRDNLRGIKKIVNNLSTKREQLPASLITIRNMLETDGIERVRIMVDFADYGRYADSTWNGHYVAALNSLRHRNVSVQILSYNRDFGRKELRTRFTSVDFEQTKVYKHKWLKHERINLKESTHLDEFIEKLLDNEQEWIRDLKGAGVEFRHCNSTLPVLCWIVDKRRSLEDKDAPIQNQAVIYFPLHEVHSDFGPDKHRLRGEGISFTTNDPHLIQGFSKVFDRLYKDNDPDKKTASFPANTSESGLYA